MVKTNRDSDESALLWTFRRERAVVIICFLFNRRMENSLQIDSICLWLVIATNLDMLADTSIVLFKTISIWQHFRQRVCQILHLFHYSRTLDFLLSSLHIYLLILLLREMAWKSFQTGWKTARFCTEKRIFCYFNSPVDEKEIVWFRKWASYWIRCANWNKNK